MVRCSDTNFEEAAIDSSNFPDSCKVLCSECSTDSCPDYTEVDGGATRGAGGAGLLLAPLVVMVGGMLK
jgi:hypothetical protein